MAINVVDCLGLARKEKKRMSIMETRKMHAWVHYYPNPGDQDDLHCHPGDQTFTVIEGQCTMSFPDGSSKELNPGGIALIEGGSFYQLKNSGTGPMILIGTRTGPVSANQHINYDTRAHIERPRRHTLPENERSDTDA